MNDSNFGDEIEKKDSNFGILATLIIVVVVVFWLGTILLLKNWTNEDKSSFGDSFGSVNALFSGLALAGIILTMLLQKKELALQRYELKYTREELKRSANAQENSEKALNRQAENIKISAKLAALNTLVNYYSDIEAHSFKSHTATFTDEMKQKRKMYVLRIEEILDNKESTG